MTWVKGIPIGSEVEELAIWLAENETRHDYFPPSATYLLYWSTIAGRLGFKAPPNRISSLSKTWQDFGKYAGPAVVALTAIYYLRLLGVM